MATPARLQAQEPRRQLAAAAGQRARAPEPRRWLGPRGGSWGQGREHHGWCWGLPKPESPPAASPVPGRRLGRRRPPAPRFQSLARSRGIGGAGDKPTGERRLLPGEGTGAGLPRWGAGLSRPLLLDERPSPILAPTCIRAEGREGESRSRTLVCLSLRKEQEGRGEAEGTRKRRGGESRAGVSRGQDHDPRLGLKHLGSQNPADG